MNASLSQQKKRADLGIKLTKKAQQSGALGSASPSLSLFPRSLTVGKNVSAKRKRLISFKEIGELQCRFEKCLQNVVNIRQEDNNPDDSVDSQRSTGSSNVTPNSITDELTNVPDPFSNQNSVRTAHSRSFVLQNASTTENCTPKRMLENGFQKLNGITAGINSNSLKKCFDNDQPLKAQSHDFRRSYENGQPSTSASISTPILNGSRKRLLSDRGEQESQFPRIDRARICVNWEGCTIVKERNCAVGLYNPLNNCFLNSVLQAVVHIPHLARMILDRNDGRMCTRNMTNCFHCALRGHIHKAVTALHPFNPIWIHPYLKKIFPHHRSGVQEDAHEMLTLLLSALEPLPPKQTPNGLKIHGPTLSTPIEQIFGGNLRNQVICNTCRHPHTNYERIREMNLGLTRTNFPTLTTLIDDFFKEEQLQNFFCSRCKKKQTATRQTYLLSAPAVLIIQLKRFNAYGGKNCTPVQTPAHIDLTKYSYKDDTSIIYKLHGVIEHIGSGLSYGHYICAMRGFKSSNNFYLFDDSDRQQITYKQLLEQMRPYILFYAMVESAASIQRRSFDGCQPSAAKQARMPNNCFFNDTNNRLNSTFNSFTS